MKTWVSYQNGNYKVIINTKNGTKIRSNDLDFFEPSTIESMDIKVTNKCQGPLIEVKSENGESHYVNVPCLMCHENSTLNGKHAHIMENGKCIIPFLNNLHPYTELACGGGNVLLWDELDDFLTFCKDKQFIPSMTVNQSHFEENYNRVKKLVDDEFIYGLGVSLVDPTDSFIEKVKTIHTSVIHVINGLVTKSELEKLKHKGLKLLILGYKEVRRGKTLYTGENKTKIDKNKEMLKELLPTIINDNWFDVVSFDNLALKQLDVKSLMTEDQWKSFYMGDDGIDGEQTSATMYVDLVERKYAKNSCSMDRYDLKDTVEEMYNSLRGKIQ